MKNRELSSGQVEFLRSMATKCEATLAETIAVCGSVDAAIAGHVSAAREHLRLALRELTEKSLVAGMKRAREEISAANWLRECVRWVDRARKAGIEV